MKRISVVLDAMGGDDAPATPVDAALTAAVEHGLRVVLVGDSPAIHAAIGNRAFPAHLINVVDAPERVLMDDSAVSAVRQNRRASIPVGLELLRNGDAQAFVSAGHTGAVVAASTIGLGRLSGVSRPGIAVPVPTLHRNPIYLIDAGALSDPTAEHLWQHARLASVYAHVTAQVSAPSVGLISNGEESTKGNSLSKAAYQLLSSDPSLNFIGNVESRAIPDRPCDVLVTDGFTGNVILKTGEGIVRLVQESLRSEFRRHWYTSLLAGILKPAMRRAGRTLDYREYGGAPLLGVKGLVFIAHGSSDRTALVNAILAAASAADRDLLDALDWTFAQTSPDAD